MVQSTSIIEYIMSVGLYCVVQYVPDRFRAEAVNIGLVLFCQNSYALRFRFLTDFDRAKKLFDINETDLRIEVESMYSRLELLSGTIRTAEDLASFAASRGNDIRLTKPRLTKLTSIDTDFDSLFTSLVL